MKPLYSNINEMETEATRFDKPVSVRLRHLGKVRGLSQWLLATEHAERAL